MSPERAQALLNRVQYRRGWTFTAFQWFDGFSVGIKVEAIVTDATGQQAEAVIQLSRELPPYLDIEEDFYKYLHQIIRQVEMHEIDEFYKVDGIHHHDPHPSATR